MTMSRSRSTDIVEARVLARVRRQITTDHISPGRLDQEDLARRRYLHEHGSPSPTSTPTARGAATTR
jgi:aconitase A